MSDGVRAARVEPAGDPARTTRAELLAAQGRFAEAERMLAATLAASPGHEQALATLVRIQMTQGRAAQASETLDSAVGAGAQLTAGLLRLRGSLKLSQARFDEAVTMFREAVVADPSDASAQHALAVALGQTGAHEAAIEAARNAIAKGHDPIAARLVLGRALWESGRAHEAETEFRRIIVQQPTHAAAHTSLADAIWMRTGDLGDATAALDASNATAPRSPELRLLKARLLEGAGEVERAYSEIARGLAFAPNHVDLHVGAARTSIAFDATRSLAHAEHALRFAPFPQAPLAILADALLANGHATRAAAAAERLLQIDANDGHAVAVLATAWRLLGDARYAALYDYSAFVRATTLDTPAGWPDLRAWLADLARALHGRHDAMRAHPVTQTLRSGTQIMLRLERDADPAIRALREAIGGPIERYLAALGHGPDRLRRRNTGRWRLADFWSVRLRDSGYHFNHYHGSGWLSSACYIELPPLANGEGWLQFGAPCMATKPALVPDYFVKPEPGLLVLFPSWMWHGTVPFSAKPGASRLTIAFDVLPA
jgi:tetratricopeptide (TPR) repeat protein